MAIDDIAKVTITASSPGPTRKGFGVPCFVGYHDRWGASSDRVRSYTSLLGLSADGFQSYDPLYKMAAAAFSQRPRPERIKIGRRSSAPNAQVVEFTPEAPSTGKVYAASVNGGQSASYTAVGGDDTAAVCTAYAAALNAVNGADVDAIIATGGASTAGTQNLTGTSLNGVIGTRAMAPARALSFTFNSHADWDATNITVTGTDGKGTVITETFAIPNGGNATVNGSKLFRTVTAVAIPAQSGTGGTFTMGVRARFTATGGSGTKVVCTAVIAGEQIDYSAWTGTLSVAETTADSDLDAQLTDIQTADKAFYGLAIEGQGKAENEIAAAWAETHGVLFVGQTGDDAAKGSGTTDVLSELKALSYGRTLTCYHPSIARYYMAAATLGNRLPKDPGSDTWANKTLVGIPSYALTDTEESNLQAKRALYYTNIAGIDMTSGGMVAGGEWVDVVRGIDWMTARMQERIVALQAQNEKIPFDDGGIEAVKGEVIAQIKDGIRVKLLTSSPAYAVSAPKAADVSDADKRLRKLPGVEFTAPLAGAILLVEISGTLTV